MATTVTQVQDFIDGEAADAAGRAIPFPSEMPHGGMKEPGYGKDLSMYSPEDYTHVKRVMVSLD